MNLFVYGTLMWPEVFSGVTGRTVEGRPAVLAGARRLRVYGEVYPALVPGDGFVEGILYENLTGADVTALDRFEGPEYERRPVTVRCDNLDVEAEVYFASGTGMTIEDVEWTPADLSPERLQQFRAFYKGWM